MFKLPFFQKRNYSSLRNNKIKPVVLVVLDGWGVAPDSDGNAIVRAKTPNYDRFVKDYLYTTLIAAGESVGLPANEVGNSEVGHLTMGAGRIIPQSLKRIDSAILDASFFDNVALLSAISYVKKNSSRLHLMGLIGSGSVHSSTKHLYALLKLSKSQGVDPILHIFTDGRDSPPKDGIEVVKKLEEYIKNERVGQIATISGRYYAMDRDRRWERTQKAYEAIVERKGQTAPSASEALKLSYEANITDEFVVPTVIGTDNSLSINDKDAVIFFNFRADRAIQLTMALTMPDFEKLKKFEFGHMTGTAKSKEEIADLGKTFARGKVVKELYFVAMTRYHKDLPINAVAFEEKPVVGVFSEILTSLGKKHMHIAESEKEKMVTYYFDGLKESLFEGESVDIAPSPKVATYDKKPEMNARGVLARFEKHLGEDVYAFFVINFANPDMVAHSGRMAATVKAVEVVDKILGEMEQMVLAAGGIMLITADHGNAEELLTYKAVSFYFASGEGDMNTDHSNNPVPFVVIGDKFKSGVGQLMSGNLGDVAPTICGIMNISASPKMTGKNLLKISEPGQSEVKNI